MKVNFGTKTCKKCGFEDWKTGFYKTYKSPKGVQYYTSYCKKCSKEMGDSYRQAKKRVGIIVNIDKDLYQRAATVAKITSGTVTSTINYLLKIGLEGAGMK